MWRCARFALRMNRRCARSSPGCASRRATCGSFRWALTWRARRGWRRPRVLADMGLLAHDESGLLVGHALYIRLDDTRAEVAVEVADRLHDRGLATILIERLARVAAEHGITRFVAEVLPQNHAMLAVFCDGFDAHVALREGTDAVDPHLGVAHGTRALPGARLERPARGRPLSTELRDRGSAGPPLAPSRVSVSPRTNATPRARRDERGSGRPRY